MVAGVLSRRPSSLWLISIILDQRAQLLEEYSKDQFACEILDGAVTNDQYRVMNEVI